jgi:predicted CXXCH cytochrome family protein
MLSWAGFLVFVFIVLGLAGAEEGTRAQDDYQGVTTCAGASCHDDIITSWNATPHSNAWNTLVGSGQKEDWCESCHTTGANDTTHNGFDPATDLPDYLKNVQCESCHGPDPMNATGGASTRVDFSAEVCSTCHRIATEGASARKYHPYYNEWINSSHSRSLDLNGGQVVTDPECRSCHVSQVAIVEVFEGGTFTGPLDDPQPITCPTCHDPHGSSNPYQLRKPVAELCGSCHHPTDPPPGGEFEHPQSAMREGKSDIPPSEVPSSSHMPNTLCMDCHMYATAGPPRITGHEFKPKPEACAVCHDGGAPPQLDVAQSGAMIDYWQGNTDDYIFATTNNATEASQLLAEAEKLGFTQTIRDQAQLLCDDAKYSLTYVEADGSQGVHNPTYAWNLLNYSNGKANEVISLLQTGTVKGRIEDDNGDPILGAQITRNGFELLKDGTLPNGSFSFDHAPGQFTFDVVLDGETIGTVSDVDVTAGELVDVGTHNFPPVAYDYTGYIILIIVIIIVIVLIVAFYWFRLREK